MKLTNNIWACEENHLLNYLNIVLNAQEMEVQAKTNAAATFNLESEPSILTKVGSTAFINIKGILSNTPPSFFDKLFGIDITTYGQIIKAVTDVANDDKIKTVQIKMNSPGGEVFGLDEAAMSVAELTKGKEVRVVNEGMIASAAYWIASQGGKILATSPSNMTGSIGVVITAIDIDFDEKVPGLKRARIVSRNAPKKIPNLENDEGRQILQNRADALERIFVGRVAEGRKVTTEKVIADFGQGGVLVAQDPSHNKPDAIKNGMIDGIININRTINEVTGTVEMAASLETKTEEGKIMSEETKSLTVQELRASSPDAVKEIEKHARATERERIQSIEKLMDSLASLPEPVKAKARTAIDAKKFDENCSEAKMSLELLSVTSTAQAEFITAQAKGGRDAANIAAKIPSGNTGDDTELTAEEATKKRRADALVEAANEMKAKKEANNA